jgi:Cu/Zn superoxide dismutase
MSVAARLLASLAIAVLVVPCISTADVTVTLQPQNNSGESGTATLADEGGKTKVTVTVTGAPAGTPQPLHIHKGTCANLDPSPAYGLPALTDGKSEATVDAAVNTLQSERYAINGHKSAQEASVYVFCGDIPAQ